MFFINPQNNTVPRIPPVPKRGSQFSWFLLAALLTVGTFVFFYFFYGITASNLVMPNYYFGGFAFAHGEDPYALTLRHGVSNQFKYSPLFALIFAGMNWFSHQRIVVGLWILVGMGSFFAGMSRWINFSGRLPWYVVIGLIASLIDLTFSLSVTQATALITGLILIGVAEYRDGRLFSAGAILMLATNLKVYPVVFLVALALKLRRDYLLGALGMGLVTFLIPALFVGWTHNWRMHLVWAHVVIGDSGGIGTLDVASAFTRIGLSSLGQVLRWCIMLVTLPLFFGYVRMVRVPDWKSWIVCGLSALILLSPRTEVFTYVLVAPAYLLMTSWCASSTEKHLQRFGGFSFALLAAIIAGCQYIDPQWSVSESPPEVIRVIGAFGFWVLSVLILLQDFQMKLRKNVRSNHETAIEASPK